LSGYAAGPANGKTSGSLPGTASLTCVDLFRAARRARWALAAAFLAGCTAHHGRPTPPATAPSSQAAAELAAVAQVAKSAAYTGTYTAASSDNPPRSSVIKVFRTGTRTRLDVTEADGHVLIQVDANGTFTCNLPATGAASCLTLAGPHETVPENLDPSGQGLFTTTLDVLAKGANLTVAAEQPRIAVGGIPEATCFALIAAPAGGAVPGTYCFTATGILTRAQFRSNVLQLTQLSGPPTDTDFTLPAVPVPLSSPTPAASS
jgi:hypothetical protein